MESKKIQSAFENYIQNNSLSGWGIRKGDWKFSFGWGLSNRFVFVDDGVELIDADLEKIIYQRDVSGLHSSGAPAGFVLVTSYRPDHKTQVFIAAFIKSDAEVLLDKLSEMASMGGDAYSERNNHVFFLVREGNQVYLRNKGRWLKSPHDYENFSPPISIDRVEYAVYPEDRNSLFVSLFTGRLAEIFGSDILHQIHPWSGESDAPLFKEKEEFSLGEITSRIKSMGGFYSDGLIERFHVALTASKRRHFVLLTGLSGTGKTRLVQLYARAIHGVSSLQMEDPNLIVCPVRPDWTDPAGLTGYHDVIAGNYNVPRFLEAILVAIENPSVPVVVLLDEMNVARIEYYFSDVLSAIELGDDAYLELHSNSVPLEASLGGKVPNRIQLPDNLYIIGTLNIDETTMPVSDKVLDRAHVIDMSEVSLSGFLDFLVDQHAELEGTTSACRSLLEEVHADLKGCGFGYRVAEEFIRYLDHASNIGSRSQDEVIDDLLVQKILVRLRGTERDRGMLDSLEEKFHSRFAKAYTVVRKLKKELGEFGSFQYSR